MATWQSIETAPKGGSEILLAYQTEDYFRVFAPCMWSPAGEISESGFWLWWQAEPEWLTEVKNPTHWMPLPAPPTTEGEN